jgi:hypothetical protein
MKRGLAGDEGRDAEAVAGVAGVLQVLLVGEVLDEGLDLPAVVHGAVAQAQVQQAVALLELVDRQVGEQVADCRSARSLSSSKNIFERQL